MIDILSADQLLFHKFQVKCDRQFGHEFHKLEPSSLQGWMADLITHCNVTLYQVSKQISPQYCLLKYLSGPQHKSYLHLRFPGQAQFSRISFLLLSGKNKWKSELRCERGLELWIFFGDRRPCCQWNVEVQGTWQDTPWPPAAARAKPPRRGPWGSPLGLLHFTGSKATCFSCCWFSFCFWFRFYCFFCYCCFFCYF